MTQVNDLTSRVYYYNRGYVYIIFYGRCHIYVKTYIATRSTKTFFVRRALQTRFRNEDFVYNFLRFSNPVCLK